MPCTVDEDDEISIKEAADMVVEAMNFKNGVQVFSLHNNLQKTPSDGIMVELLQIINYTRHYFWQGQLVESLQVMNFIRHFFW